MLYEDPSSEMELKNIDKPNLVYSGVGNGCTLEVNESSVTSLEKTPPTFLSDIHRII